jgi:hypothetical protein
MFGGTSPAPTLARGSRNEPLSASGTAAAVATKARRAVSWLVVQECSRGDAEDPPVAAASRCCCSQMARLPEMYGLENDVPDDLVVEFSCVLTVI